MFMRTNSAFLGRGMLCGVLAAGAIALSSGNAQAQSNFTAATLSGKLFINEILINPPSGMGDDAAWEYIELKGCPGQSLRGLAVIVVNGTNATTTENDETFVFPDSDKYKLDSNGYFVLWNSGADNAASSQALMEDQCDQSSVYAILPQRQTLPDGTGPDITSLTTRYEASFDELGTRGDTNDLPGQLANDGSITVLLIDRIAGGTSIASISKDVDPDTADGTFDGNIGAAWKHIDSVAYSNNGGHEYTLRNGDEWDFTPGYIPDAMTRVDKVASGNDGVSTTRNVKNTCPSNTQDEYRDAYTNWVAGDLNSSKKYTKGFGGLTPPTTTDITFCVNDLTNANLFITPGAANGTINGRGQISVTCP